MTGTEPELCEPRPAGVIATLAFRDGTTMFFGANNQLAYVTDQNDNKTFYAYTAQPGKLWLESITDTQGRRVSFATDTSTEMTTGLLDETRDAQGYQRTTSYFTDQQRNLRQYTDAAGGVTLYEYNGSQDLAKITDPEGSADGSVV